MHRDLTGRFYIYYKPGLAHIVDHRTGDIVVSLPSDGTLANKVVRRLNDAPLAADAATIHEKGAAYGLYELAERYAREAKAC